jgi:FkbM family methyltransferase
MIDAQTEKLYWRGAHDPAVLSELARVLTPGQTFWDVGAHIGYVSLFASKLVGPTGTVHAFEPDLLNAQRLHANIRLNSISNVKVHQVAVSDITGTAAFYQHNRTGSLLPQEDSQRVMVDCTTLDAMLTDLPMPDVIKIDVEGGELRVLFGASRVLARRPILIVELQSESETHAILPGWEFRRLDDRSNWLLTAH